MASQQPQPRPWFRLASMARPPAPAPAPTAPRAPAPQPRPPFIRPAFVVPTPTPTPTPTAQPAQPPPPPPQEPTPPPPPPPASTPPPQVAPASPPPTGRVSSVPTSPITKSTATTTPSPKTSPTALPRITSSASLPSSPKPSIPPPPSPPKPIISVPSSSTMPISSPPKPLSPSSPSPQAPALVSPPAPISAPAPVTTPAPPYSSPATALIARLFGPSSPKMDVKPPAPEASPAPKIKSVAPAPPPLTLPPAQLKPGLMEQESKIPPEAEQKTVLVQESTIAKQFAMPSGTRRTTSIFNHQRDMVGDNQSSSAPGVALNGKQVDVTKDKGNRKKVINSDSKGFGARIVTLAGDNKGAIMEFNPSQKKKASDNNSSTHKTGTNSSAPLNAFINSNVQDVNNSIAFNSSLAHHDPGVHLSLALSTIANKGSAGSGIHMKDRNNG